MRRGRYQCRARRGRLVGDRPEGVDKRCDELPAGSGHGAHRSQRSQAPWHHRHDHRSGGTGCGDPPLKEITGATLFNEVFFTDVFVPDRDIVGEVNAGWKVAMATFGNERVSLGGGSVTLPADKLADLLEQYRSGDTGLAREVGALLVESYCLAALNLRRAARAVFDSGSTIEGNIAKLYGAEHAQRVAELALCIVTPAVLVGEQAEVVHDYLYSRCLTIAGGTSEIIRNLIAERILGLPRDPLLA